MATGSCKKSAPEATPPSEAKQPPEARQPPRKALREVIVGTWAARDIGKGKREFTAIYTGDGVNENRAADGRSSKEQYRVIDERSIEFVGPPAVKATVTVVSDDELRLEFADGVVLQQTRKR